MKTKRFVDEMVAIGAMFATLGQVWAAEFATATTTASTKAGPLPDPTVPPPASAWRG